MKYAAILLVGILIGYFLRPTEQASLPPEKINDFQNLIDHEAKNYALQRDADAKLKAAEELYGKMMVLFLANLSLKSTHQFVPAEKAVVKNTSPKTQFTEEYESDPVVEPKDSPVVMGKETLPPTKTPIKQTPQQIYDQFRSAHYIDSFKAKERRLLGQYVGSLLRLKPKESTDSIRFEFNLVQDGKNLTGETLVTMTDDTGKEYSRNAGNGGNRALKVNPNEPDSYYVDASPTSFFIVSFKHFPAITGNYYEKGVNIGKVILRKTQGDM